MANGSNKFFSNLKKFFNITSKKPQGYDKAIPFPGDSDKGQKNPNLKPAQMSDELLELYNFFLRDTFDTSETLKNRLDRYNSLEYAYYNSPIISATIDLYADEATQVDEQSQIIEIDAKDKKVKKFIQDFFSRIGLSQKILRDVAWNVSLYGDSFWTLPTNPKEGITEIVPVSPFSVKERLEFNAVEAQKRINKNTKKLGTFINRDSNLKAIQKMMDNDTGDFSEHFKNYLFGFQVENLMLPPWNVLHFRAFTTQSEFHPFGRPVLINSLAPFRQLQASKNLMALGRATAFNLKHFKVKTDENATWEDKWEAVNEARQQYKNLGNEPSGKEQFTVNSELWTPEDLVTVDNIESRFDPEKVGDVEMLRDDLIMGTRIPKGYLVVDKSSFGTSGQALLAQHKPFARAVYSIQSTILEQLTMMVKMQMVMTGSFDPDEADFQLRMAFPQTEESKDRISAKSDLLRLAKDVIDNVGEALGLDRGEALPPEVVKQILSDITFLDNEDVEDWVDKTIQQQQADDESEEDLMASMSRDRKNVIQERFYENPNLVQECLYQACRRSGLSEGVMGHRHYYTSYEAPDLTAKQTLEALKSGRKSGEIKG